MKWFGQRRKNSSPTLFCNNNVNVVVTNITIEIKETSYLHIETYQESDVSFYHISDKISKLLLYQS